jgi:L-threonylcarbamoyladenylate synthase
MAGAVERAIAALQEGRPVLLATDTVYGLAGNPEREEWALAALALKGRSDSKPTALLAASVEALLEHIPELSETEHVLRALLPGPFTLVMPNPARRYPWLTGERRDAIGVRVPVLPEPSRQVLARVGAVLATSANEAGGRDPATLDEVPRRVREACAAEIDAGRLPGTPSTVLDLTGQEPRVLREGAAPSDEALARVRVARGQ